MKQDTAQREGAPGHRAAAVAGRFYPAEPDALRQTVQALLDDAPRASGPAPKAMILPHAGYIYSGPVAAAACRFLEGVAAQIRRVVLLGPAHRVYLEGLAVPTAEAFDTPLGPVPLDRNTIHKLASMREVRVSDVAHRDEHCLEVELPFLQTILKDFTLVPVLVGWATPGQVAAVIDAAWGGPETLIVVSSDLSHYQQYTEACRFDACTCRAILNKSSDLRDEQACGAQAINGLMQASHCGPLEVQAVRLCNSGDTSGDKSHVVGYGAFVLH